MDSPGYHTLNEILSQPKAWAAALQLIQAQTKRLREFYRAGQYDSVIFTGGGSTYYLALSAAAVPQDLSGVPSRGLPASEIWFYPRFAYASNRHTPLVAISRSGETKCAART
jgi:glucosamine--fructose-6-phosphate aminotransferase (isomerizing)